MGGRLITSQHNTLLEIRKVYSVGRRKFPASGWCGSGVMPMMVRMELGGRLQLRRKWRVRQSKSKGIMVGESCFDIKQQTAIMANTSGSVSFTFTLLRPELDLSC
ncbi:hypothetical protein AC781_07520 [Akkermansia glycaniphila]|nr:hypothetical protein AC781_07520 [Akkermansia glycaniphila]